MKKVIFLILFLSCFIPSLHSQNVLRLSIADSASNEKLAGAIVTMENSSKGAAANIDGYAEIADIPDGKHSFLINYTGYNSFRFSVTFPQADANAIIAIRLSAEEQDVVIISSTRTNARIEDLPVKVEVLGQEEMDEESTLVPGGIGSILGDLSVITIQKTNPVSGNDAVRMQGLDYKYTQLLRDGLPLYEGFSGSLGVLAIPPLDLKQVEIIKGSASTLYGGSAIGGLINFISKTPSDTPRVTLTLNQTSLYETNLNAFLSKKDQRVGVTFFTGMNFRQSVDVNNDGFTEVPEQRNFIFHPRLFFYPVNKKLSANIGLTVNADSRRGGDVYALQHSSDTLHSFLFNENVLRTTVDGHFSWQPDAAHVVSLKTSGSVFDRSLGYNGFLFAARQRSTYTELNHLFHSEKHTLVTGVNFTTESFRKLESDSVYFGSYDYTTFGAFAQEDWQLFKKLSVEAGIRFDYHNRYKGFILPAVGLFYKPADFISVRLHYGSGYKTPNLFSTSQPADYPRLIAISANVKPERSNGLNADFDFHTVLFGKLSVQLNQAFYYTVIDNPTVLQTDTSGRILVSNGDYRVSSVGTDTYLRLELENWELYVGYNHTEAVLTGTNVHFNMPFNPKDKFATTLAWKLEGKWRAGVEAAYNANQYIYDNIRVPDYWFVAAMIERKFSHGSLVLNCENLGDYRQSRYEPLVTGTTTNPVFTNIWGPVEGRVMNLCLKINL
ncbi:MAG: TonB-dependent receptor [Bacteroidota bacterium]|nr:TonB-dependent receptor [Bacteroidota bacterium]